MFLLARDLTVEGEAEHVNWRLWLPLCCHTLEAICSMFLKTAKKQIHGCSVGIGSVCENRQSPFLAYNFVEGAFDYFCLRPMHWPFSKQSFVFIKLFTCRFQELANVTMDLYVLNYTSLCSEGHLQENPHALLARWILFHPFRSDNHTHF